MRFASLNNSNARDYAQAGKSVADSASDSFTIMRRSGPDYGKLSEVAMNTRTAEKMAAMKAGADMATAGIKAVSGVTQTGIKTAAGMKLAKDKANRVKMAGKVAGIGAVLGGAVMAATDKKEDSSWKDKHYAAQKALQEKRIAMLDQEDANDYGRTAPPSMDGAPGVPELPSVSSGTGGESSSDLSAAGSSSTGNAKILQDAIAKYESGSLGYEAFNQGGAAGGTKVIGKSGNHAKVFGKSLTSMSLGEIFHRQNTKQRGLSMQQHIDQGGLHAVGRYQFIGSTLQDEVNRMGLSHDTLFTPEVQDKIFLSHIKRVGSISPWVGPMQHYSAAERARLNGLIGTL